MHCRVCERDPDEYDRAIRELGDKYDSSLAKERRLREFVSDELAAAKASMSAATAELDRAPMLPGNVERVMALSDRVNQLKKLLEE